MKSNPFAQVIASGVIASSAALLPLATANAQDTAADNSPAAPEVAPASAPDAMANITPVDDTGDMAEVIVTAQRREEKSRDVPISIISLNADQLATANVNQLADTAKLTPGLRFDAAGPAMQPSIRGVGTADADRRPRSVRQQLHAARRAALQAG